MHKVLSVIVLAAAFLAGCGDGQKGGANVPRSGAATTQGDASPRAGAVAAQSGPWQVQFDDKGLAGMVHNGVTLVHPDDPRFRVQCAKVPDGNSHDVQLVYQPQPVKSSFNAASKTLTLEYGWGKVEAVYAVPKDHLEIQVSLTNSTAEPIHDCVFAPFELDVPNIPANAGEYDHPRGVRPATFQEGAQDFAGHLYVHDKGVVGLVGDAFLYFRDGSPHGSRPVCAPGPTAASAVAPGKTESYRMSLYFGPPGATLPDVAPDVYAEYVKANPMFLNWPDRRPIATAFLCNSACGLPKNPRGWFQADKSVDVTTEEGIVAFGERLMKYADNCIARMKVMNAQGIIIWDIEGQEMPHATSYIGDPRPLAKVAPEMDRFADAFMKKFSDAGFKTGITIRPSEIIQYGGRWTQGGVADPIMAMSDKIDYAKRRWGTTIYYMDSDFIHGGPMPSDLRIPWILPASGEKIEPSIRKELGRGVISAGFMEKLARLHPDCLISPEFSSRGLYRFCAPYSSPNLFDGGTDPVIRRVWPQAFRLVMTSNSLLTKNWEQFVDSVEHGDVMMYPSWFDAMECTIIRMMYREAEFRRKGAPTALAKADLATLAAKAKDSNEETRYAAACTLCFAASTAEDLHLAIGSPAGWKPGQETKTKVVATLSAMLNDDSPVVRKQALVALGQLRKLDDANCIAQLFEVVRGRGDPNVGALQFFAADALGQAGDAAVPKLLELLADAKSSGAWLCAVRALGRSGAKDANVAATLVAILDDKNKGMLRIDTIEALGLLKVKDAVPALVSIIEKREAGEPERGAAVIALGRIGDARAVEPLVKHFDVRYSTVVVYWLKGALDESLRSITGVQGVVGGYEWKAWLKKQAEH